MESNPSPRTNTKSQSDPKDSSPQKCSSTQKSSMKTIDNQQTSQSIKSSNFVPSMPEENYTTTSHSHEDQLYSKVSKKDSKIMSRKESIKDSTSMKNFPKPRYIFFKNIVNPNRRQCARQPLSTICSLAGKINAMRKTRIQQGLSYKGRILRKRLIDMSVQCCFFENMIYPFVKLMTLIDFTNIYKMIIITLYLIYTLVSFIYHYQSLPKPYQLHLKIEN